MFWPKFEGCHHIFFILFHMIAVAQNSIHSLLYTSSRQNLNASFNLSFSDTISYENFYTASMLQKNTVLKCNSILVNPT